MRSTGIKAFLLSRPQFHLNYLPADLEHCDSVEFIKSKQSLFSTFNELLDPFPSCLQWLDYRCLEYTTAPEMQGAYLLFSFSPPEGERVSSVSDIYDGLKDENLPLLSEVLALRKER